MTNGNSAERERFEKYAESTGLSTAIDSENGAYLRRSIQEAWDGWQARAALSVCADGGKGERVAWQWRNKVFGTWHFATDIHHAELMRENGHDTRALAVAAPQAECAPRALPELSAHRTIPATGAVPVEIVVAETYGSAPRLPKVGEKISPDRPHITFFSDHYWLYESQFTLKFEELEDLAQFMRVSAWYLPEKGADADTEGASDLLPNALWTRRGSGTDEWWSFRGYEAKKDTAAQWVLRKSGKELYRHTDLQVVMAHAERAILAANKEK